MRRFYIYGLLIFAIYYMLKGSTGIVSDLTSGRTALLMDGITQSEMTETILTHYKTKVIPEVVDFTADAINTTIEDLNNDGKEDVIAIVESARTCGTGGCLASVFIENDLGELIAIPFSYAVRNIEVLESATGGMRDLRVNGDTSTRLVWDGTTYVQEQI